VSTLELAKDMGADGAIIGKCLCLEIYTRKADDSGLVPLRHRTEFIELERRLPEAGHLRLV
jgi:hypothetical protein